MVIARHKPQGPVNEKIASMQLGIPFNMCVITHYKVTPAFRDSLRNWSSGTMPLRLASYCNHRTVTRRMLVTLGVQDHVNIASSHQNPTYEHERHGTSRRSSNHESPYYTYNITYNQAIGRSDIGIIFHDAEDRNWKLPNGAASAWLRVVTTPYITTSPRSPM